MQATQPTKIAEGREAEIFAWGEGEVLRLYRDPNAQQRVEREMLALNAVRYALPCVPAPLGRLDWNGRPGIRMERLDVTCLRSSDLDSLEDGLCFLRR